MLCLCKDGKLLACIIVSILIWSQKQKFIVVTLKSVTFFVFKPKIDACYGFVFVSDILYALRNWQNWLGKSFYEGSCVYTLYLRWCKSCCLVLLCSPSTCPGRYIFETLVKAYFHLARTMSPGVHSLLAENILRWILDPSRLLERRLV